MLTSNQRSELVGERGGCCEECGQEGELHVHHKDRDRTNDKPANLVVLCQPCHCDRHRDELAERSSGPQQERRGGDGVGSAGADTSPPAQRSLLDLLRDGRVTAPFAADETGYSLQYCREQLANLVEHGHVVKVHDGLYELDDDPEVDNE